jgi:hypothetical protein
MMLTHKIRQLCRAIKWRREVRQALSTYLEFMEDPTDAHLGMLSADDEARIVELVERARAHPGPIVEIGTLFGLTTRLIAAHARADQPVITVDNFCWNPFGLPRPLHEAFTRRLLRAELAAGRIVLAAADSGGFRAAYRGPAPALVFLDADHSYGPVRDEIAWAKSLGAAIICGHDYGDPKFGVTRAVDEAFGAGNVAVGGTVWSWERAA